MFLKTFQFVEEKNENQNKEMKDVRTLSRAEGNRSENSDDNYLEVEDYK